MTSRPDSSGPLPASRSDAGSDRERRAAGPRPHAAARLARAAELVDAWIARRPAHSEPGDADSRSDAAVSSTAPLSHVAQSICADELREQHPELSDEIDLFLSRLTVLRRARARAAQIADLESRFEPTPETPRDRVPGYELLQPIEGGGQGQVYLARRLATDAIVAIKVLHSLGSHGGAESHQDRLRRFDREVRAMSAVTHPGVVGILEHGQTDRGHSFLAMPYVEGNDLDPVALRERLSLSQRVGLMIEISRAVGAAHASGVVHRDLKPSNIRLDSEGKPHVLDFGLAAQTEGDGRQARRSMTHSGQFVGTFLWSSPEQLAARPVTPASDVYALGVILHQLATGGSFPPQVFSNLQQALGSRDASATVRPSRDMPSVLAKLIDAALESSPADRPADATQFAERLQSILPCLSDTSSGSARRWRRITVAVALLLVGTTAVVAWRTAGDAQPAAEPAAVVNGRPVLHVDGVGSFVWCPPGEFVARGPHEDASGTLSAVDIERRVTVERGFYVMTTEVTRELYASVMDEDPAVFKGEMLPVEYISFHQAVAFCEKLSERIGRPVRLPSEWEWEYFARAGSDAPFGMGTDPLTVVEFGNVADASAASPRLVPTIESSDGYARTARVGSFRPNPWGIFDTTGNVWEWCAAPYVLDPSRPDSIQPGRAPARGGSWFDLPAKLGRRHSLTQDARESTVGFRIVIDEP